MSDATTLQQWEELVRAKAKDPSAPLVTELEDGLQTQWLYTAADAISESAQTLPGEAPFLRGTRVGTPWQIRQENAATDRGAANLQILEELVGGATEVLLRIDPGGVGGIPVQTLDQLDEVLVGVHLDLAPVALENTLLDTETAIATAELLTGLWRRRGHSADQIRGSLRLDGAGDPHATAAIIAALPAIRSEFPGVQVLAVDSGSYADVGAGPVQELALALATAVSYLHAGEEAGIDPAQIAAALEFTLVAGPDQFIEIAKFRAARLLWAKALEHSGVAEQDRHSPLYARTSRRMMSSLDPWTNMLRATTAAFAAGVGGADGVTVVPFDEPAGEASAQPGPLGRRIARNTQLILLEEANLFRVADPAGGSWYVESLTQQIAHAAWARLQEIESAGGIAAALSSGVVADGLAAASAARHKLVATRKRELTGVNTFPLLGDDGLDRAEGSAGRGGVASGPPRKVIRDASDFEHLRARADAITRTHGKAPQMLLACMGPLAAHVAINQWAKSFFEAGGVGTISSGPQPDAAAQAALLREHELSVAALCPGKDVAAEDQAALITALRDAGASRVYLVGAGDEAAISAGADAGVKSGVDLVQVLGELLTYFEEQAV